jgi:hypothetical protein
LDLLEKMAPRVKKVNLVQLDIMVNKVQLVLMDPQDQTDLLDLQGLLDLRGILEKKATMV